MKFMLILSSFMVAVLTRGSLIPKGGGAVDIGRHEGTR
jgi:hypothetical protein